LRSSTGWGGERVCLLRFFKKSGERFDDRCFAASWAARDDEQGISSCGFNGNVLLWREGDSEASLCLFDCMGNGFIAYRSFRSGGGSRGDEARYRVFSLIVGIKEDSVSIVCKFSFVEKSVEVFA
jgi:hypothetical protein